MRILFTGGTGKAGRHVTRYLRDQGHHVVNLDLSPLGADGIDDIQGDVTDLGQVMSILTGYANFDELEPGTGVPGFDAIVHFAAIARILITSDNECFRVNTIGTYNMLEAAAKLGIGKVVIASSETTYGICFADGRADPEYLPVDEEHPTVPEDAYALSKVVNEATARTIQKRTGSDIYALRIGNVFEPDEYHRFKDFCEHPGQRRRNIFNYVDARDLGQIVDLCLKTDGLGYQVFNAANDGNSIDMPADEIARQFFPGVPLRGTLEGDKGLYSNQKVREVLGFREAHDWRRNLSK